MVHLLAESREKEKPPESGGFSFSHYAYVCRESAHRDEGSPLGSPIGGRAKPLAAARRVTESW